MAFGLRFYTQTQVCFSSKREIVGPEALCVRICLTMIIIGIDLSELTNELSIYRTTITQKFSFSNLQTKIEIKNSKRFTLKINLITNIIIL